MEPLIAAAILALVAAYFVKIAGQIYSGIVFRIKYKNQTLERNPAFDRKNGYSAPLIMGQNQQNFVSQKRVKKTSLKHQSYDDYYDYDARVKKYKSKKNYTSNYKETDSKEIK